jgi:hypothetical protein
MHSLIIVLFYDMHSTKYGNIPTVDDLKIALKGGYKALVELKKGGT